MTHKQVPKRHQADGDRDEKKGQMPHEQRCPVFDPLQTDYPGGEQREQQEHADEIARHRQLERANKRIARLTEEQQGGDLYGDERPFLDGCSHGFLLAQAITSELKRLAATAVLNDQKCLNASRFRAGLHPQTLPGRCCPCIPMPCGCRSASGGIKPEITIFGAGTAVQGEIGTDLTAHCVPVECPVDG
jgi:hypothetical protein